MSTKQKQSFFERLTGTKSVEPQPHPMNPGRPAFPIYEESVEEEVIAPMYHPSPAHQQPMQHAPITHEDAWENSESSDGDGQLTIDVYQTENDIVIKSTIAGVKPEDLDVAINNDMVTIKGERKNEEVIPQDNYYYQECYWGSFSRSILLPIDIVADKVEASLKNGILTIKLPKADTTKIKKIQVRGF